MCQKGRNFVGVFGLQAGMIEFRDDWIALCVTFWCWSWLSFACCPEDWGYIYMVQMSSLAGLTCWPLLSQPCRLRLQSRNWDSVKTCFHSFFSFLKGDPIHVFSIIHSLIRCFMRSALFRLDLESMRLNDGSSCAERWFLVSYIPGGRCLEARKRHEACS